MEEHVERKKILNDVLSFSECLCFYFSLGKRSEKQIPYMVKVVARNSFTGNISPNSFHQNAQLCSNQSDKNKNKNQH